MLSFLLGILTVLLGARAFARSGLPLTREKNLTGPTAKVLGVGCILLGVAFFVDGLLGTASIISMFDDNNMTSNESAFEEKDSPFNRWTNYVTPNVWDPALDVPKDACDESADDHELAGKWEIVWAEVAGRNLTTIGYYEFQGNNLRIVEGTVINERTFEMDPNSEPKRLDSRQTFPQGTGVFRAIYRIDGNTLTISDATPFHARPDRFVEKTTKANDYSLCTFWRVADEE